MLELNHEEENLIDRLLEVTNGDMKLLNEVIERHTIIVNGERHIDIESVERGVTHEMGEREFDGSIEDAILSATKSWA